MVSDGATWPSGVNSLAVAFGDSEQRCRVVLSSPLGKPLTRSPQSVGKIGLADALSPDNGVLVRSLSTKPNPHRPGESGCDYDSERSQLGRRSKASRSGVLPPRPPVASVSSRSHNLRHGQCEDAEASRSGKRLSFLVSRYLRVVLAGRGERRRIPGRCAYSVERATLTKYHGFPTVSTSTGR